MYLVPKNENIIEKKICPISGQEFFVTDKDIEFYNKISPIFSGKKFAVLSPTLCPDERQRRRLCFRNERRFYHRKCDKTGNQMISIYSPDKPYRVYEQKTWWSDDWSAHDFTRDIDFSQSFFSQFHELQLTVPRVNLFAKNCENAEFTNHTDHIKNSYLSVDAGGGSENIYYAKWIIGCKDCVDSYQLEKCQLCYECQYCVNIFNCKHCFLCDDCSDCQFSYRLNNCKNCLFCTHLRNKEFHILNKSYTKKEFEIEKKKLDMYSFNQEQTLKSMYQDMMYRCTHEHLILINCEKAFGDFNYNAKNVFYGFEAVDSENLRYCFEDMGLKDSYDVYESGFQCEQQYECHANNRTKFSAFCSIGYDNSFLYYSELCNNSQYLFGCIGIKHGHHCILNRPYSLNEYEELAVKIIDHMRSTGEWGEFFPHELSPFGYDETVAQEYFPMTEEEIRNMPRFEEWRFGNKPPFVKGGAEHQRGGGIFASKNPQSCDTKYPSHDSSFNKGAFGTGGWNWKGEEETSSYHGPYYTPLPIEQYDEKIVGYEVAKKNIDELLNGILQCEVTKKPFKVIRQELAFYIENGIPIPSKHPDQRHKERMQMRNPRKLFERKCTECAKDIITTYAPEKLERVVCEECYRRLVYS